MKILLRPALCAAGPVPPLSPIWLQNKLILRTNGAVLKFNLQLGPYFVFAVMVAAAIAKGLEARWRQFARPEGRLN